LPVLNSPRAQGTNRVLRARRDATRIFETTFREQGSVGLPGTREIESTVTVSREESSSLRSRSARHGTPSPQHLLLIDRLGLNASFKVSTKRGKDQYTEFQDGAATLNDGRHRNRKLALLHGS
jgi:hypothetical protein